MKPSQICRDSYSLCLEKNTDPLDMTSLNSLIKKTLKNLMKHLAILDSNKEGNDCIALYQDIE